MEEYIYRMLFWLVSILLKLIVVGDKNTLLFPFLVFFFQILLHFGLTKLIRGMPSITSQVSHSTPAIGIPSYKIKFER